jgi:hypothetical protein
VKRLRKRDWRFLLLVLAHAVCIVGFVAGGLGGEPPATGGWRRVDLEELESRIRAGDLVKREADWYRVLPESAGVGR